MAMQGLVHVEIPARDLRRAKDFYGKVFGWQFQDAGKDYTLFSPPGGGVGGGINRVKQVPKRPVVQAYIEVADIDTKLKEVKKARGKVSKRKKEDPRARRPAGRPPPPPPPPPRRYTCLSLTSPSSRTCSRLTI